MKPTSWHSHKRPIATKPEEQNNKEQQASKCTWNRGSRKPTINTLIAGYNVQRTTNKTNEEY
jgi:hypothetical protein